MKKKLTRIDMFQDLDAVFKFWEWTKTQPPEKKTRADMIRLLGEYKRADLVVDAHPERVEHELVKKLKTARAKFVKKGDQQ